MCLSLCHAGSVRQIDLLQVVETSLDSLMVRSDKHATHASRETPEPAPAIPATWSFTEVPIGYGREGQGRGDRTRLAARFGDDPTMTR